MFYDDTVDDSIGLKCICQEHILLVMKGFSWWVYIYLYNQS